MRYVVLVYFTTPKGNMHRLGTWQGPAENEAAARALALEAIWDPRLESSGCTPYLEVIRPNPRGC